MAAAEFQFFQRFAARRLIGYEITTFRHRSLSVLMSILKVIILAIAQGLAELGMLAVIGLQSVSGIMVKSYE
jgi:hypothetical protein